MTNPDRFFVAVLTVLSAMCNERMTATSGYVLPPLYAMAGLFCSFMAVQICRNSRPSP